ncbi:cytochrome P450 52A12 [Massariosphaeria phaeospora]|uniref:Cytochrome P450 52A12 n=1 Tax=Massariosphaeria phaeospora TaxID=100035 RepID=A0A7C8M7M0_9PLEO|nr:cytochrome P450 52A12 [Massariosphaeria phaeospora]
MHNPILLALWAAAAFVLFKIVVYVSTELRHRYNARKLDCQIPPRFVAGDYLGIINIRNSIKANNDFRLLDHLKGVMDHVSEREGFPHNTVYQNLLGSPAVFTTDPKNIQTILAVQFKNFGLGDSRNGNFYPLLGRGIFSSDGAQWEHARALLRPQFAREQVSDLDLQERHIQELMCALPISTESGWTNVTNIQPLFFRLTIDSATEFLFGTSVGSQLANLPGHSSDKAPIANEIDFAAAFDRAQTLIAKAARFGDLYYLAHNAELKEQCRRCHVFIDRYVDLALKRPQKTTQETSSGEKQKYVFIDALVESTRDPLELRAHLLNILLAGRDTTASLLSYVFMLLTDHPEVYSKLRTVILEEFGTYAHPRDISFAKLKSCSYLQWVLSETLRLYPVVPIDGRRALTDTTLPTGGGPDGKSPIYIRKHMPVDYSVYVMHRRKDLWGADADDFKPERWNGRRVGWEFLPFNGGPRICIGQQFALTEAGYTIVRLLQRFEAIEGVGNSWESVEKGGVGYVRQKATLTVCPADGVKLRMKEAK